MIKDKYILAFFLIFIILFMSYWNTHKSEWNNETKKLENFTTYYNTIYNQTARNCRHLNRDTKEYIGKKVSGFTNYFKRKKK